MDFWSDFTNDMKHHSEIAMRLAKAEIQEEEKKEKEKEYLKKELERLRNDVELCRTEQAYLLKLITELKGAKYERP